jgi:alcohol oxidase
LHGFNGPINVSGGTYRVNKSESDFIQAAQKVGYSEIEDLASLDANNGVTRALRYVGTDGIRQDAANRYIHPKVQSGKYPNLRIVVESQVKRILFDGKRACGVEYRPKVTRDATIRTIRAKKMVVVSAGALGSPSVLERSGLGNPKILQKAGVELVASHLGIGENYQDHHLLTYPYYSSLQENETIDAIVSGRVDVGKLIQEDAPILGWNSMDIAYKIRPTEAEAAALGPNFQATWDKEYKDKPDRPLALGSLINASVLAHLTLLCLLTFISFPGDPSLVPAGQYFAMSVFTGYPLSRGSIHISGPEVGDKLNFTTGFFSDANGVDIKKHVWAYKKQREIFRRMDTYRGELAMLHPPFPPDSAAALVTLTDKPVGNITDIVYSAEDDQIIEDFLRAHVETTWHSLGTCKMAPLEENGVVDERLNVYGVLGLKVADLSVPPRNVAANTMNTAVAIAEKAADILIEDLCL